MDWALANVLRNAPAKIQRKKNDTGREEDDEEGETGSLRDDRENLTGIE